MPLGNDRKYGRVYVITFELGSLRTHTHLLRRIWLRWKHCQVGLVCYGSIRHLNNCSYYLPTITRNSADLVPSEIIDPF